MIAVPDKPLTALICCILTDDDAHTELDAAMQVYECWNEMTADERLSAWWQVQWDWNARERTVRGRARE